MSSNNQSTSTDSMTSQETDSSEVKSMFQIIFAQFLEHRVAVVSICILSIFILIAIFAPLIESFTGINSEAQSVFNRYAPPLTEIELSRDQQDQKFDTITDNKEFAKNMLIQLAEQKVININQIILTDDTLIKETLLDYFDTRSSTESLSKTLSSLNSKESTQLKQTISTFNSFHLLGTDELGRDVFMRLIYGTRVSMMVGVLVAIVSALIGMLIGSIAGYYGGWIDNLLMRVTDSLLSLPILPLMIVFAAVDLKKIPFLDNLISGQNESIVKLIIILVTFSWMQAARLIRGSILSIREREFVLAAKTLGSVDSKIIKTHIIPNAIAPLLVAVTLNVGNSILWEAALSFLGFGIQPPTPSWGNMLFNAQEIIHEAPLLAVMPGLLIFITVICFNFVGDGLQDAIDPKAIKR